MATPTPQPGWYPDQNDPSRQRYFDGTKWTEHTAQLTPPQAASSQPGWAPPTLPVTKPPKQPLPLAMKVVIGGGIGVLAIVAIAMQATTKTVSPSTKSAPTSYAVQVPSIPKAPTPPPRTGPKTAIDEDGTFLVGQDLVPGTYRTDGSDSCYWERLSGLGGNFSDIISNSGADGQQVVQILPSDAAFKTQRCGLWKKIG